MRELTLPIPLIVLPGLGADGTLFAQQRKAFGDEAIVVPEWVEPYDDEPLHLYAKRFAERLGPTLPSKYALGGVSFGGMVAQELLRFLDPKPAVTLLISSARSTDAVPTWAQLTGKFAGLAPESAMTVFQQVASMPFAKLNGGDDEAVSIFAGMAKRHDPALFRWSIGQVAEWQGPPSPEKLGPDAPPIYAIHGEKDPVLRCEPKRADRVVPDGKHLIMLTHAKSVNRWIFERVLSVCPEAQLDYPAIEDPDTTVARRAALAG